MKLKILQSTDFDVKKGCWYNGGFFYLTGIDGQPEVISDEHLQAACILQANSIKNQARLMGIIGVGLMVSGLILPGLCFALAPFIAKKKYSNLLALHFDDGRAFAIRADTKVMNLMSGLAKDPNRYEHIF